jgi:peptide-methionine (S)-S-oxide reductase
VTTLEQLEVFYVAEDYHQDYAARNPGQPYITFVAQPKVAKLRENFGDRLKPCG